MRRVGEANAEPSRSWVRGEFLHTRTFYDPLTLTLSPWPTPPK